MQKSIVKVENPSFMSYDEIRKKYWGKQVLMTDVELSTNPSALVGAVVQYYAENSMRELWKLLDSNYGDVQGDCTVRFIGNINLNLYAGGGDS